MNPLFSIITVTYNATTTLPATLKSVNEQTCRLFEYIIMDGASKDNTVTLAKEANIDNAHIFSEPDKGLYDAMNKAMDKATGEYIIFLNAGDTFHSPHTLQQIADTIMQNDFPGIVYGQTQLVDEERKRTGDRHLSAPESLSLKSFSNGMVVCHQAFIALRRITGQYDLSYKFSADYDWCIRCLQHSRNNVYINDIIIDYLNEGLTTANHKASLRERYHIMCHYYGTIPTIIKHLSFIPRYIRHKLNTK